MAVPAPQLLVPRGARAAELARSLETLAVTLVVAPPGYGKTTLLGLACERLTMAVARYSIELWHADDFTRPLVDAIRSVRPEFGRRTLALASRKPLEPGALKAWSRQLGATFASELEHIREPLLIAIDDAHVLADDPVFADFLAGALGAQSAHLHLALAGRTMPGLPIAEWVAAGRARVFSLDDVRFDEDDVRALADKIGTHVSEADLGPFLSLYEGWAAGIALAFAAGEATVPSRLGSLPVRSAYLVEANLGALGAPIVEFLERTAVFETLDAALLEREPEFQLARAHLSELERRGIMLEVIRPGAVYRIHPLLREALLERVRARGPAEIAAAHLRGAAILEGSGRIREALYHYERGGDDRELAHFIGRHAYDSFIAGQGERIARIAKRLERAHVDAPAVFALVDGMIARQRGEPGAEDAFLRGIAHAEVTDPVGIACRVLLAEDRVARRQAIAPQEFAILVEAARTAGPLVEATVLVFAGWLAAIAGDFEEAGARARRSTALVGEDPIGRTRAASLAAYAEIGLGAFEAADAIMAATLRMLEASEHVVLLANTLVWYARFALLWNDVAAARDYAERGRTLARELDLPAELAGVELALAEVFARTGDRARCEAAAANAVRGAANAWYASDRDRIGALAALFRGRAAFGDGDTREALAIVRAALAENDVPHAQRCALTADVAAYAVLSNDAHRSTAFDDASAALARANASDALDAALISDAATLIAILAADARPAKTIAASGTLRAVYGAYIAARIATQENDDGALALVRALRPALRARSTQTKAPRSSELTAREDEILQLIAQGLTNREIAQRFTLSPRTVDTHVERVLSKLGANSRTRAVATAMRLGLVLQGQD